MQNFNEKVTKKDIFNTLKDVNVTSLISKKNGLDYLPWANAWALIMEHFPNSDYKIKEFPRLRPRELRQALARMGLTAQQAMSPLKELSGGEQEKVKLAKMQFEPSNLLFLDEPTNHLDIATKDSLRKAIVEFNGGVIIVSHERDFFRGNWVDKTIDIEKMNNE